MRLFLAIDLPEALRRDLAEIRTELEPRCPGWRWVRPEGIHLTLRFLGEVERERDAHSRESWSRVCAASGKARFRLGGLGVFPGPSRPRVLWVAVNEEPGSASRLESLAHGLEEAARELGFAREARPFRPHLTLARAARVGRPTLPPPASRGEGALVEAGEIVLFRSELAPAGARYTRLAAFPLGSDL